MFVKMRGAYYSAQNPKPRNFAELSNLLDLTISPPLAFDFAISEGILSSDPVADNFAGNYMFMGREPVQGLAFKNIITRDYVYIKDKRAA